MTAKARIVIEIGGGLIQHVLSNGVEVDLAVVDYDADDVHPRDMIKCPALSGSAEPRTTYATKYGSEVDPQRVDAIFTAIEQAEPAFSEDELAQLEASNSE